MRCSPLLLRLGDFPVVIYEFLGLLSILFFLVFIRMKLSLVCTVALTGGVVTAAPEGLNGCAPNNPLLALRNDMFGKGPRIFCSAFIGETRTVSSKVTQTVVGTQVTTLSKILVTVTTSGCEDRPSPPLSLSQVSLGIMG
jgi:hypothetical protein